MPSMYSYMEPAQVKVETPLGDVHFIWWGDNGQITWGTSYAYTAHGPIVINGVSYTGSIYLRKLDGTVTLTEVMNHPVYMTRVDSWDEATSAAKKKACDVMVPAIDAFLKANPDIDRKGMLAHLNNAAWYAETAFTRAEHDYNEKRAAFKAARNAIAIF